MGLDTSHDCFHGPYSQFMEWRQWLNLYVMRGRADAGDKAAEAIRNMGATNEAIGRAWEERMYDDQSVPINVLMNHSDCDGEIAASDCGPLADALEALANKYMAVRGTYDKYRPTTDRFIAGLRAAAAAGENVRFG